MKNTRKIIAALLATIMLLLSMTALTAFAADGEAMIYLTPNDNWKKDNARFAIYTWITDGDYLWIDMTDSDNNGIYEAAIPAGYTNVIFCRLTPNDTHNGWSTTWNQTNDLVYDGTKNHYTVGSGAWSKGEGSWSVYDESACAHNYVNGICSNCGAELVYIIAGNVMKADGEYRSGDNSTLFVSKWDVEDEYNRMTYDAESGCYIKIYEGVAAGEYHFKVVENKSWDISYGDGEGNCYLKVEQDGSTVVITFKDGNITSAASRPIIEKPNQSEDNKNENKDDVVDTDKTPDGSDKTAGTNEPEVKLNFFQKIWKAITDFFKKIFGGKKK